MTNLPIEPLLADIKDALLVHDQLIIEAAPGAGKTTLVPLALFNEPWMTANDTSQKILMLEPRRIAARQAAERMAELLDEEVGETVGYRVRMDKKVSDKTRIEVVTEGILNRMLLDDPSLDGIAAVIFDEFHERSLDADLGLALCLQGRELFGDMRDSPLKLIVMSATLDGKQIQAYIESACGNECPSLVSEGRAFPVEIIWQAPSSISQNKPKLQTLVDQVCQCVEQALADQTGSMLVFLPGQREIVSVHQQLNQILNHDESVMITPLYGALSLKEQRKAIEPAPSGYRKIVLTTSIAETSLTIEGVRVVIDSGLARLPEYDPKTAMTRLKTERVSRASAKQRAGRAGRLEPGVCYRLWSEEQHQSLASFTAPEIEQADLAPVVLQLIQWGINNPNELDWLTPPKASTYNQATDLLNELEALNSESSALSDHGNAMTQLAMHPRLAHMLIKSLNIETGDASPSLIACQLAALLSERDPMSVSGTSELMQRLALLSDHPKQANSPLIKRIQQLSKQYQQQLARINHPRSQTIHVSKQDLPGLLTALAYPDRIAQKVEPSKSNHPNHITYKLSNGRQAQLAANDPLAKSAYISVSQLGGQAGQTSDRIFIASPLNPNTLKTVEPSLFTEEVSVEWSSKEERLLAEQRQRLGKLTLHTQPLTKIPVEKKQAALINFVKRKGLSVFNWPPELTNWCQRIELLRAQESQSLIAQNQESKGQESKDQESKRQDESRWPDMSEQGLLESMDQWLSPFLNDISHINHFKKLDLKTILATRLPWPLPKELDEQAPERIRVPSGSNIKIDYSQNPPVLAVKLQEMFGQTDTPSIANGKVNLLVHLLSPAQRPLQVTQDLAGFWNSSYELVKKDMKGRYPKHHWPDNPLEAEATARAKPRK